MLLMIISKIKLIFSLIKLIFFDKEENVMDSMAVIYATLIVKGVKVITQVPLLLRDKVKQILVDLDLPELAEEPEEPEEPVE